MKKEINPEQGKRLRECLNEQRFSQKELAEKSGYTPQYISNIVVGKKNMSYESASAFAKILHVKTEFLLCEIDCKTDAEMLKECLNWEIETQHVICNLLNQMGYDIEIQAEYQNMKTNETVLVSNDDFPPNLNPIEECRFRGDAVLYECNGKMVSQTQEDFEKVNQPSHKLIAETHILRDPDENLEIALSHKEWSDFLNDIYDYITFKLGRLYHSK